MIALISLQLLITAITAGILLCRRGKTFSTSFAFFLLTTLSLLLLYNQVNSPGRAILATGLLMPSSLLTQFVLIPVPIWLRRLLEPFFWGVIINCFTLSHDSIGSIATKRWFRTASLSFLLLLSFESFLLAPGVITALTESSLIPVAKALHVLLTQVALISLILALLIENFHHLTETFLSANRVFKVFNFSALLLSLIITLSALGFHHKALRNKQLIVGAHYYSWFPENWVAGYLGSNLTPPVAPALGDYLSSDQKIFEQHITWAKEAGINLMVFDWWPQRMMVRKRLVQHLSRPNSLQGLNFAMFYESQDLKRTWDKRYPGETENIIYMDKKRAWRMKKHWAHLAKAFMKHESYLRINGKPVLFVYATRHLVGPLKEAVAEAREYVRKKTGEELFIVGDEVFFNVLTTSPQNEVLLLPDLTPHWERISAFDALTAYNPYDSSRTEHSGSSGAPRFLSDVNKLYRNYYAVCSASGIMFIPGVLPGYNDRGVRLAKNHFVIPRLLGKSLEKQFFSESLKHWAADLLNPEFPLFVVTSFNEWNEWTQIEPSTETEITHYDQSTTQTDFTVGEPHHGYGSIYLKTLKQFTEQEQAARTQGLFNFSRRIDQ